jgi:hypothetical protein
MAKAISLFFASKKRYSGEPTTILSSLGVWSWRKTIL